MAQVNIETCFNYTAREAGFFSSNEMKLINRVRKLAKEHQDEVTILAEPENNDGCIYAKIPASYFRLQAPNRQCLTEEKREILRTRMRDLRQRGKNRAEGAE